MHPSHLSRRRFFTLSGLAAAGALLPRAIARACPALDDVTTATTIANAINGFAADLHGRIGKEKGSHFFSPLSIETALAMTSAGARGQTLDEMQKVLHLPADPHAAFGDLLRELNGGGLRCKRDYELATANAIWAQKGYPWRKEFTELVGKHYGAGVVETDFAETEAARKQINGWVETATREKIKNLVPRGVLSPLTRMVLTNAVYFKGTWRFKFDPKQTRDAAFHRGDGTSASVPLMSQTADLGYGEFNLPVQWAGDRVQVLELPYAGGELSMVVYLPKDANGTGRLATWLHAERIGRPDVEVQRVQVALPKFKIETDYSLKPVLMDLGMVAAFGGADFSGMHSGNGSPYISHVLHKAFVEVAEAGTEAAAATAVVLKDRAGPRDEPVVFRADRPFVFTIRDNKTGAALFLGRYSGPKA